MTPTRTPSYRCTLSVVNGEIAPQDAQILAQLRHRVRMDNLNLAARRDNAQRRSWGLVTPSGGRSWAFVTPSRVTLKYRGPRRGHLYHSPKATAHAVDVYVHDRRTWGVSL